MKQEIDWVDVPARDLAKEYADKAMEKMKFGMASWTDIMRAYLAGHEAAKNPPPKVAKVDLR